MAPNKVVFSAGFETLVATEISGVNEYGVISGFFWPKLFDFLTYFDWI